MSSPFSQTATQAEIVATRAMVAAVGKALVKKGVITHSDVASELSTFIQGSAGMDPLLEAELKEILGVVLGW